MDDGWTNLTPEQRARLKDFWRTPMSLMINALHHDGLETYPRLPNHSLFEGKGLWMCRLGIEPGTRMYLGIGRELFILGGAPSPEPLSQALVHFEKTRGSWRLGPVG
ncbi:hypothetical protein QE424_001796 [Stenotrophomonas rhizophila]|uniref:Uncharacterized protein n=1 Tax=Stenotrophomonas rhizophila TaxID=216778 RepID=A0AAP5AIL1_9GAMM|nr:hypothetical protein [Stenotrophomonas rhizophila]MDQ1108637.1 hypothetical protein [Stenotrophomonas rhizophila]